MFYVLEQKNRSFLMQKYKVFINDRWIFFGEMTSNQIAENEECEVLLGTDQLLYNFTEMIKTGTFTRNIVLNYAGNIKAFFEKFLTYFLVLDAAGGLVEQYNDSFLMIKRFGIWDFPKGKIEQGENNREAALREVEEETGVLNLSIDRELSTTYHIYRFGPHWVVKRTFWFLMKSDFEGKLVPQKEEDILEAVWVKKKELPNYLRGSYGTLIDLVKESGILSKEL